MTTAQIVTLVVALLGFLGHFAKPVAVRVRNNRKPKQ